MKMKIKTFCALVLIAPALAACKQREPEQLAPAQAVAAQAVPSIATDTTRAVARDDSSRSRVEQRVIARNAGAVRSALDTAMFAGGCFWSMQRPFESIIFTRNAAQRSAAENSKMALNRSTHFKSPIVTEIVANARFWRGEEYHQHFADRNPDRYNAYKRGCGRDARLHELWGDAAPYVPKD